MSVLKSKRKLSKHEYVIAYYNLYNYITNQFNKVAKRKQKWICNPIIEKLNNLFNMINDTNCNFFSEQKKLCDTPEIANLIIEKLLDLQKNMIVFWNIERCETKKMVRCADLINEEIEYIEKLGMLNNKYPRFYIIDYEAVKNVKFLNAISKLHRLIYTKVISLQSNIRNTKGTLLMSCADDALYLAFDANKSIPTTKKEYEVREKKMTLAYKRLKAMNRPMFELFNLMQYSENVMIELSSSLDNASKLLYGVIKSDKERFSELK